MSSADSTTAAGSGGVATPSTSSLPYSAPHLLKQLTSSSTPSGSSPAHIIVTTSSMGVTRPSPCSSNSVSAVPRKRLKLDMDAANNRGNNSSSRKRLLEKRQARLKRVTESYKDNISELFFLQSHGNVVDLPAFRKKPSEEFLSFLASQKAPAHVLADVRLTVFGPNSQSAAVAAAAATIGNGGGRVTVSSAAMAAAVVAAQGGTTHWSRTTTTTPSSSSVKTASYSPRSSMVSPVKYGELLTPQPPPLRSTLASYRLASYTKDQLDEKVRQEAWVTRRVADLSREGLWSDRRLPKVCERPRGKTQWDSLLQEMQWLAVDFYQERQWKVAAAKLLAYSAKEYVEQRAEAKAKAEEAKVRRHKKIASYIASQVLLFWNNIALASLRSNNYNYSIAETGVCNLDEDEDDDVCVSDSEEDDDDESTIAEQEAHELEEGHYCTPAQELRLLAEDNSTPLETLLSTDFYSGYTSNNTTSDHDDLSIASSSEEYDEDGDSSVISSPDEDDNDSEFSEEEEEFVMEDVEKVLPLPLSSKQRKLYDDYLSGPYSRSALENGDALSISTVLNTLRKICNHPHLMKTNNILLPHQIGGGEEDTIRLPTCFPRVLDNLELPRIVTRASQYEPLAHIDLASLNLVFLTHESTLTAITSDRIRKCCANKSLIEELPQRPPSAPSVPEARLALEIHPATGGAVATPSSSSSTTTNRITLNSQLVQTINGQHMFLTSSAIKNKRAAAKEEKLGGEAFHQDSLHVIARFNERRCTGMPLYGQDLLDALTVVDTAKPTVKPLNRWRGSGHVACLNASYCTRNVDLENAWPLGKQKRPPHPAKVTATLKKLVGVARQAAIIHSDLYDNYLASTRVESVHLDKATSPNLIVQRMQSQYLPLVNRVLNSRRRQLKEEEDEEVHSKRRCHPPLIRNMSAKLAKLDALLQSFRKRNERALVFCEMPEMISILCSFLHRHHYPFIYLDPVQSVEARLDLLEQFAARPAMLVLLATPDTTPPPPKGVPHVDNVVFFDSNWNNVVPVDSVRWCKQLSSRSQNLTVYRLVCQGTVEDSISIKALQRRLLNSGGEHLMVKGPENGSSVPMWKIKRQTLEALFNPHFGDNGVISAAAAAAAADDKRKDSNKKIGREAVMEEILGDPETIAQLDWLWSSKHEDNKSKGETVVELSQQLDTDCMDVPNKQKPIERYARGLLTRLLDEMPPKKVVDYLSPLDSEKSKVEWEENYQRELAELAAELDKLERLQPSLTYTREDASRTWHGRDGQPMALWTPPMPSAPSLMDLDTFSVEHHLSFLYQTTLVDESDLPPVYVKKEALKRSHSHFSSLDSIEAKHKIRKEDLANGGGGGPFSSTSMQPSSSMHAPRSLFDRHTALQKQKLKQLQRRNTSTHGGSGSSHHPGSSGPGGVPHNSHPSGINLQAPVAGLRHPLPRPQVEAENAPEWLIQEDFYLLRTVRELQGLQLTLVNASPAHTTNWDLISDMVNAVSRVYRGPRQCRQRYETIVVPREEGRILYDMPQAAASAAASSAFAAMAASSNNKKKKKAQLKLPTAPTKVNRSLKTSQMYGQDKNTSWTSLYSNRFESIKAVANKRSPTTKPLVVNSAQKNSKHAAVLAESGINYDGPLNPIQVAAKRAERIQKEKQRTQQDAAQQLTQQRVAAAQAAANVAKQTAAATARVGVTHVQQQQQQQQQAVVVGIGQQQQQVLQGRLQGQTVQDLVRSQQPQPPQQSTVVVSSQPPVVSVANLTQSQLLAAQKVVNQAGSVKAGGMITTPTGRPLTPQQVNALRQQALLKRQQQEAANKNRLQGLSPAATAVVAATTSTGQKVSLAVTPAGNVALSTMASTGSMTAGAVTVVTQAMAGQPKAHLIRQLSAGANKGNLRTMTEADMKMLLAKQHQQQQQQQQQMQQGGKTTQVPTSQQGHLTAQILAQHGIHVQQSTTGSGGQVATLVKAVSASGTNQTQSVTIPVTGINLPQMKAAIARGAASGPQAQMQLHLRQQLQLQQRKAAAAAQAQAQGTGQQQKVALGQVVAGSKGGVPQLVVSSAGGQKPQAVTVQQIQQIVKSVQPQQQQQVIPHQAQNTTVQARVIPVSATAGRAPQIQVVAAAPGQTVRAVGAPNVTVDPSGRPTNNASQLANALGSHIRVAAGGGTQQIISQVSAALGGQPVTVAVRTPAGNVITQSQTTTTASKLQVVGMQQQQQQQQNSDQNS